MQVMNGSVLGGALVFLGQSPYTFNYSCHTEFVHAIGGKAEHTGMCAARKVNLVSGNLYRFTSDCFTFFSVIGNKIIY